tara:strand:+ start:483 stop:617 length:135 start_codon:yes stop_codon:yes gene_type:complete
MASGKALYRWLSRVKDISVSGIVLEIAIAAMRAFAFRNEAGPPD